MAVYTEVSFEELERLLEQYDIGQPLSFKGIAEGIENSNFYLQTDRGAFILTLYEKRVAAEDLPFFLGLMEHLARGRGALPPAGQDPRAARHWSISTAATPPSSPSSPASRCAGPTPRIAPRRPRGCWPACTRRAKAFPLAAPMRWGRRAGGRWPKPSMAPTPSRMALSALMTNALEELAPAWPTDLPAGVIHADYFPDNVLFVGNEVGGVIDFYFACNDFYVYDLAIMLNSWCFELDGSYNITKGQSVINAYRQQRPLSEAEIDALPVLMRGAALRFLLTRTYDWLNRDPNALVRPKDPREYSKKLRFHNKVRHAREYGL